MSWWRNRDSRDLAIGLVAGAAMIAQALAGTHSRGPAWVNVLGYGAIGACVVVRRRHTFAACLTMFVLAVLVTQFGTHVADGSIVLFVVAFMLYTAGYELDLRRALIVLGGVALTVLVVEAVGHRQPSISDDFFPIGVFTLTWGVGRALHNHAMLTRELAITNERLELEREERAREAVVDERRRIARELHDVVAHSVSVMVVQSGAARRTLDRDPRRAEQALAAAEESGRTALVELRRMLGLLGDDAPEAGRAPQPALREVAALIERARDAGLDVELREHGEPFPLAAGADLAAFRVVQEALTNTIKHAGPTRATVTLDWTDEALELEITDDGGRESSGGGLGGSGQGLIGMRERLELYGGHVDAGADRTGGFRVHASIPRDTVIAA